MLTIDVPIANAASLDAIFNDRARFKILAKGRRVGVTRSKANHYTEELLGGEPRKFLWVDTIHRNIDRYFERFFFPVLRGIPSKFWAWNAQKKTLKILDGYVDFGSVEKAENLEGFGYDRIFLNEAGIILGGANDDGQRLWEETLRPMVADTGGEIMAAGVPKGARNNFFPELIERAQSTDGWGYWKLTSYDSPYLTREAVEEMERDMRPATARQEIHAEVVDVGETDRPWLTDLSDDHTSERAVFNPELPVVLSFDFNIDPMACTLHHIWSDDNGHHWHTFGEVVEFKASVPGFVGKLRGRLERMGARVLPRILVTGDATGRKRDILSRDHTHAWALIQRELRVAQARLMVPTTNPTVAGSRELCNTILFSHPDVAIHPDCKTLLFEMNYTEADEDGRIPKKNRARLEQRADALDTWRYVANSFLVDYIERPGKYRKP